MAKAPLTTRIALEGGEEVIKMLRAMGAEGEAAADKLEKSFQNLGIGKNVEGNLSKLRAAFKTIQSAGSQVGKSFANVGQSFDKLGQAAGRTRNRVLLFTAALTAAGYGVERFIKGGINALGDLQDLSDSLNISAENLQGFGLAAAQVGVDGGDLTKSIVGIDEAIKELRETAKSGVGDGLGKSFSQVVTQGGKLVNIYRGVQNSGAQLEQSILQITDASGRQVDIYLDAAKKQKYATGEVSDKVKALTKIFGAMGFELKKNTTSLDILRVMARYFSEAKDQGELLGLAVDVFGAKLGPKMVRLLKQGEDAITGYKETLRGIGVLVSDEETALADTAGDKLSVLGKVFEGFRNRLAAQFAPSIIRATDAVMSFLKRNGASISSFIERVGRAVQLVTSRALASGSGLERFITRIATSINSLLDDIILLASGGSDDRVRNQWLISLRDGLAAAGEAARYVFFELLPAAFQKARQAAEPVAAFINSIFGTNLTADGLLIAGVVLQMAGAFDVLFAALSAVGSVVVAIATIIGLFGAIPAAIIVGIATAAAAIYIFWDELVAGSAERWNAITEIVTGAWNNIIGVLVAGNDLFVRSMVSLRDSVAGLWVGLTELVKDLWNGAVDYISSTIDSLISKIRSVISAISSAASKAKNFLTTPWEKSSSGSAGAQGRAGGGYIRGPGTTTSDSIPAWLSNGEFVIRAAAVRRYGADLFAALNGMRLSPNTLGRFAMGGLVGLPAMPMAALPASAGPTSSLTLVLDNQQFAGLTGSSDTIARLERAIKLKRVRSTGRSNPYER